MTLLHHLKAKRELVGWNDVWDCYVWNSPRINLTGITKVLKRRFYPRVTKKIKAKAKNALGTPNKRYLRGIKGGKFVHEQLEEFVSLSKKEGGLDEFKRKYKTPDPRVLSIIHEVLSRNWKILYAEYIVADKTRKWGTGIDLLCMDAKGELGIIEIKTGHERDYVGSCPIAMKAPMQDLDRSPYSQHQLQLLVTHELFTIFTGIKATYCEVWLVTVPSCGSQSVPPRIFPLHPKIADRGDVVLACLDSKKKEKGKRKT